MNRDHDAAGHLLFGLLALQTGLIDQAQLVAAFHAWTRDKARPLADHLVALGTPAYMSPEQARGDLEHLGPRSDVYSLGATLYCLLTGRPPVERDDVGAVLRAVQQGDFPPPRSLDPSVDRALEALCLKAMALRPEDRYGSARELAEDVERWAADQPVTAWPEPILRRARRWARRHKPLVACAAVLLAATVIALVAGTILLSRANSRTEKQRQVAEANYRRARQAVDEYFTRVSESKLLDVPGLQPLRKELLEAALKYYQDFLRERGDDRAVRAESAAAYFRAADVTRLIGSHDEAMALYRSSFDLYEALVREHSREPRYQADQAIVCDRLGNLLRISRFPAMFRSCSGRSIQPGHRPSRPGHSPERIGSPRRSHGVSRGSPPRPRGRRRGTSSTRSRESDDSVGWDRWP